MFAFVQTNGLKGDLLRELLFVNWGLSAWERQPDAERRRYTTDADVLRQLAFVWLHNNLRGVRALKACEKLVAQGETPPMVSR
jgi:hypothetical protein